MSNNLITAALLSILACACTKEDKSGTFRETPQLSAVSPNANFLGLWTSGCDRREDFSAEYFVEISETAIKNITKIYADLDCKNLASIYSPESSLTLEGPSKSIQGAVNIQKLLLRYMITHVTQEAVAKANQGECRKRDWKVSVPAECEQPDAPKPVHSFLKLEGENLYVGSSSEFGEDNGLEPESRHTNPGNPYSRVEK